MLLLFYFWYWFMNLTWVAPLLLEFFCTPNVLLIYLLSLPSTLVLRLWVFVMWLLSLSLEGALPVWSEIWAFDLLEMKLFLMWVLELYTMSLLWLTEIFLLSANAAVPPGLLMLPLLWLDMCDTAVLTVFMFNAPTSFSSSESSVYLYGGLDLS